MGKSVLYFTGLGLTILGLIGIFSEFGTVLIRYIALVLGVSLLIIFFVIKNRGKKM